MQKRFWSKVAKIMGTQIMICQKLSTSSKRKQINIDDMILIGKIMEFDLILIDIFQTHCTVALPLDLLNFILYKRCDITFTEMRPRGQKKGIQFV